MGGLSGFRAVALAAALWLLAPALAGAAGPSLDSEPSGARIELAGPITLGGTAPLPLGDLPAGRYRIGVGGHGFAEARGRFILRKDGEAELNRLTGPTAILLPPGFAHLRQGETTRGWTFLAGAAGGLTGFLLKASDLADADDQADRARAVYDGAVSQDAFEEARLTLLAVNDRRADEAGLRDMWLGFVGATWIGAALETWILTPRPTLTRGEDGGFVVDARPAVPAAAALRSALVPGAGQRYLGAPARGNRFSAAIMTLGAGSILAHQSFLSARRDQNDAQRHYREAQTETETRLWKRRLSDAADRTADRDRMRWGLVAATAGVYLWNVIDAAMASPDEGPASGLGLNLSPEDGGFRAGLTWRSF